MEAAMLNRGMAGQRGCCYFPIQNCITFAASPPALPTNASLPSKYILKLHKGENSLVEGDFLAEKMTVEKSIKHTPLSLFINTVSWGHFSFYILGPRIYNVGALFSILAYNMYFILPTPNF